MNRAFFPLVVLLSAGAALATPSPEPFVSGWGHPVDPDRDCKIRRNSGILTIEMPGTYHDYDPHRKRFNAPRLPRDLDGDFVMQVRLRIDCRPSVESTVVDQHSFVAAGFLLIRPNEWLRLEYQVAGPRILSGGRVIEIDRSAGAGGLFWEWDKRRQNWPFKSEPEHVYLRLQREGDRLDHSVSPDGKVWMAAGGVNTIGLPSKLQVALAAYTTSSEPSKVRFDQLKLTRGKNKSK